MWILRNYSSKCSDIECGVHRGWILGLALFNLYILPLGNVIERHINFHSFVDDNQLYVAMSPDDTGSLSALFNCILDMKSCLAENFLLLNKDKTFGSGVKREKLVSKLQSLSFNLCGQAENLGVLFDSELSFELHIRDITKKVFFT